jgi:hypothetical protein
MEKWFRILLNCSIWLIHFVAFSGLIYKSSFYKSIPVVAGEPYGLGDLIDLLFTVLVISIWLTAFIAVAVLSLINFKHNFSDSIKLFLYISIAPVCYFYLLTH